MYPSPRSNPHCILTFADWCSPHLARHHGRLYYETAYLLYDRGQVLRIPWTLHRSSKLARARRPSASADGLLFRHNGCVFPRHPGTLYVSPNTPGKITLLPRQKAAFVGDRLAPRQVQEQCLVPRSARGIRLCQPARIFIKVSFLVAHLHSPSISPSFHLHHSSPTNPPQPC